MFLREVLSLLSHFRLLTLQADTDMDEVPELREALLQDDEKYVSEAC